MKITKLNSGILLIDGEYNTTIFKDDKNHCKKIVEFDGISEEDVIITRFIVEGKSRAKSLIEIAEEEKLKMFCLEQAIKSREVTYGSYSTIEMAEKFYKNIKQG